MISNKTKNRWDYYNVIDGAKIQGQEIGAHEKAVKVAIELKAKKTPIDEIADLTDLSIEEIKEL